MSQNLLRNIYLFKEFTVDELRLIDGTCSTVSYQNGTEIFIEGEVATAFFVIKMGSVQISHKGSKGTPVDIARLGTGSHFGEMAFIDNEKRSATATAAESSEILKIDFEKLNNVLASNPTLAVKFYKSCSHFLCGRLRATTHDLSFAREKMLSHF